MTFTHVDLFSGAGGSCLGFKLAGFDTRLTVEWDAHAAATYRVNFPTTTLFHGDIAKLSVDDALGMAGLAPGELSCMSMSPPCQGFSSCGSREFNDPRNQLFREAVRLLEGFRPVSFVCENVKGMVAGKMRLIFRDIMEAFRGAGYTVAAKLLDASYFNVAQRRLRVIIVGTRSDSAITPSHPLPQCRPLTVREAWLRPTDICEQRGDPVGDKVLPLARLIPPGDSNGGGKYSLPLNGSINNFGLCRLAWDRPSFTICKTSILNSCMMHPDRHERITIDQAKRLASFPDSFVLPGAFADQWARIGNSVPPNLMRAIAEHVRDNILAKAAESRAA